MKFVPGVQNVTNHYQRKQQKKNTTFHYTCNGDAKVEHALKYMYQILEHALIYHIFKANSLLHYVK